MAAGNDRDQEMQEYLSGESPLSQAYRRQGTETPPVSVDDAILAAARREAKPRRRLAASPFGSHWPVPASLAAVLVIAVGLVMMLEEQTGIVSQAPEPMLETDASRPASKDVVEEKSRSRLVAPGVKAKREPEPRGIRSMRLEEAQEEAPAPLTSPVLTAPKKAVRRTDRLPPAENAVPSTAADAEPTAAQWLTQIKDLIKQGRQDEADKLIERFRKRYPDYPIDTELGLDN